MWLFSVIGFFSVVAHPKNKDQVQIRARFKGDLDALRTRYLPTLSPSVQIPGRDYPERAYAGREELALAMANIVRDVVYENFKDEVTKRQGHSRHDTYMRVWGVLRQAEDAPRVHFSRPTTFARGEFSDEDTFADPFLPEEIDPDKELPFGAPSAPKRVRNIPVHRVVEPARRSSKRTARS